MRPEMPYLAAGAVALVGGVAKEKHFPKAGLPAVIGTVVLVIVASATAGTRVAPLVRAIGTLLLMAAIFAATKAIQKAKTNHG